MLREERTHNFIPKFPPVSSNFIMYMGNVDVAD